MNVSSSTAGVGSLARTNAVGPARGLDVTVSDRGIDIKSAAAPQAPAPTTPTVSDPATESRGSESVASTAQLQETLTTQETDALAERFASLPRTSPAGLYGRAGRQAAAPLAAHQGQFIDITG